MSINKVVYNGNTLIDLTGDTVDASNLLAGYTAHDRSGTSIQGAFDPSVYVLKAGDTMTGDLIKRQNNGSTSYERALISHNAIRLGESNNGTVTNWVNLVKGSSDGNGLFVNDTTNRRYGYYKDDSFSIYKYDGNSTDYTYDDIEAKNQTISVIRNIHTNGSLSESYLAYITAGSYSIFENNSLMSRLNALGLHVYDSNATEVSAVTKNSLKINGHDILRLTPHFAQTFATNIQANADLNTSTHCAVGEYYAGSDATVATLSNCPTTVAFSMKVCAPIQTTYDNESSAWVYRVRTIVNLRGEEWVQYCYTGSGGAWNYSEWKRVLTNAPSTYAQTNITSATDANLSLTVNFGGNWYRKSGNVVEINVSVSGATDGWRTVTTLPEAYRPSVDRYFSALTLSFGVGAIYISSAGLLRVRTAAGNGTVGGCITYIV